MRRKITPGLVLGGIAVLLSMSGSAVAGSLITSAKIQDGTIRNKDIRVFQDGVYITKKGE